MKSIRFIFTKLSYTRLICYGPVLFFCCLSIMLGEEDRSSPKNEDPKVFVKEAESVKSRVLIKPWGVYLGMPISELEKALPAETLLGKSFEKLGQERVYELTHDNNEYILYLFIQKLDDANKVTSITASLKIK